ncbi:SurA N-terminal domain-containing protein [Tibeticola sp.]|uniref:SurA N-terminal domain-containing protein n=1 Tax=Tibeticola sp. TaxID=2005368 RepID=UPI0025E1B14E|nr:SurA N-terminal domain-containing protein [Tibeticola sp.]
MFDFVRKHMKVMQFLLFLLIVPSFVLFGLDGYNRFRDKAPPVARVAGHDVTQAEWDAAQKAEVQRARDTMPTVDVKLLDTPQARYATLERLVQQRVLAAAADKMRLVTTDARLAAELQQNPTIAALRKPDGSLDIERYRQLLALQGLTPAAFEAQVRADLSSRQVLLGVTESAFTPAAVANVGLDAFFERREVQVARFLPADFQAKVTVSEEDLQAFYKRNEARFRAPEQADIEYVVLDPEAIGKTLNISEADLRADYEQNAARYGAPEERRASHILIAAGKDQPQAERDKARARAEALLAEVRKAPARFAELAKQNSQDPGSAAKGGDLGFFARGAMVKPFEDAAFSLKKGEISDVVASDFGYHIIELTDIKPATIKPFEQVRGQVEADLRKQLAQRRFAEVADAFTNDVYEQADNLKAVADKLKLPLLTAKGVTRQPAPDAKGALANPKFLAALFSPDSLEKKRNTEAVEIGSNQLVAGRVVSYTPAKTRPFEEVRDQVKALLVAERAAELARKEGMARLAEWKKDPAAASGLGAAVVISRTEAQGLAPAVVDAVMRVARGQMPSLVGVDLGSAGYVLARVNKVMPKEPLPATVERQNLQRYAELWSSEEARAYYELLKARFKAEILVPRPKPDETADGSGAAAQ